MARGICHTGHVGYENFGMSSRFLEGAILIYLRRKKQVAPNKSLEGRAEYENQLEQNEEGFEGAYVKDPIPGRYDSNTHATINFTLGTISTPLIGFIQNGTLYHTASLISSSQSGGKMPPEGAIPINRVSG